MSPYDQFIEACSYVHIVGVPKDIFAPLCKPDFYAKRIIRAAEKLDPGELKEQDATLMFNFAQFLIEKTLQCEETAEKLLQILKNHNYSFKMRTALNA